MNERFYLLRKALKLSQEAFGKRIKISGAALSRIENGVNNASQQTVDLICREFGVNEEWLVNGNGDMFTASTDDTIAAVCEKHKFSAIERKMLETYVALEPKYREGVLQYVENLVASLCAPAAKTIEEEAAEEAEAYRKEYIQAKKGQTSSVSGNGSERTV